MKADDELTALARALVALNKPLSDYDVCDRCPTAFSMCPECFRTLPGHREDCPIGAALARARELAQEE